METIELTREAGAPAAPKVTERPINLKAHDVRAIMAGRKTQLCQIIKPQPEMQENGRWHVRNAHGGLLNVEQQDIADRQIDYVPWQVGDRLWVRETWATWMHAPVFPAETMAGQLSRSEIVYKATDDAWDQLIADRKALRELASKREDGRVGNWIVRSPIHMPRWASRITLDVTDVQVQRLQDISEEDAAAEGVEPLCHPEGRPDLTWVGHPLVCRAPSMAFRDLWNSLHGADAWAANPWICALTFRVSPSPAIGGEL